MAPFFSAGQHAYGFIAVGQIATGVIAIGQVATGAIAIGQVARGGIAIGMGAFGIIAIGMISVGALYAGGIVGIGARSWFGWVLELMPMPTRPRRYPSPVRIEHLDAPGTEGWLPIQLALRGSGSIAFTHEGRDIEARVAADLGRAAQRFASLRGRGLALMRRPAEGGPLVCVRIVQQDKLRHGAPAFWILGAARLALLAALSYLVWRLAVLPVTGVL